MYSAQHECGHASNWRQSSVAPKPGEYITCAICGEATKILKLVGPHRIKCLSCRRIDTTYTLEKTAEQAALRHLQEYSTHRMRLWQWGDIQSVRVWTHRETGIQFPLVSDAPF